MKLIRPFAWQGPPPITQLYGNQAPFEPLGYMGADMVISYSPRGVRGEERGHYHNGVDYGLPCGTVLIAPGGGTVEMAGISPTGFGLRLIIRHGLYRSLLGHMSQIDVYVGTRVRKGQRVGLSGGGMGDYRDGNSTGCHLHWSVLDANYWYYPPASRM